ncbi:serine-rich adhesin for platelets [Stomoxys calcitrans]|uniref:serine-rich adhesin for platelets n=1 Tax=Stomoxys calcitrans TaxID=35570 RepID=UPI0027E310A6|nr:serine-rich adhesin for platelets [Stomoxys calcitrans]
MVIQRGWKILSDAGSTSASSTEANRSPTGLNSSSDDSNCSNQTTHSMVTSASPVASHHKLESIINSNESCTNTGNIMKFVTTPQMAEMTLQKLRQRFSNTTPMSSSSAESGMRSLELVRIAVQTAFDKEIDELVKQYIETYFKPAFNNIKENLGQGAVNEDALQKMSCALLENAKSQYKILRFKPQSSAPINSNLATAISGVQDNNSIRMALKRPAPNKPSATVIEIQKRFFPDNMIIKTTSTAAVAQQLNPPQIIPVVGTLVQSQSTTTSFVQQQQHSSQQKIQANVVVPQPPRRQIFWNTAHISTSTKFVLDVQANQAFGFGAEKERRLASKHPELIRYLPDNEDRDWLVSQQIIPQPNRNSRFLFLIYDEVCRLYQTHEAYKSKSSIDLSVMMTFTVPDFMIQKMKIFFVDLNIKSRGLITNSYSIGGGVPPSVAQSNSHLRNALLLGTTTTTTTTQTSVAGAGVASPSSSATSSNVAGGTMTTETVSTGNLSSTPATSSNIPTSSSSSSSTSSASSSNITSTDGLLPQKSKSSNLSSSHATLTALLNNSTPATNEKSNNTSASTTSNLASSTPTLLNKLRK